MKCKVIEDETLSISISLMKCTWKLKRARSNVMIYVYMNLCTYNMCDTLTIRIKMLYCIE